MKTRSALLFALLLPLAAAAQDPRFHVQLRGEETISVLSQTYLGGSTWPATSDALTNYARRFDLHLGGLMEKGILRVGLGIRLGLVNQEFYSILGTLLKNTNETAATLGILPEVGMRLGPLYLGAGFHWVPTPESNRLIADTESFDHYRPNAPVLRLQLDQKLWKAPVWVSLGGAWCPPVGGSSSNQAAAAEGGFRFDLTYYLAAELRYRAWFGAPDSRHYAMVQFTYRFTPSWSAAAHWSRLLYTEGASPQNRVGAGAVWTSKKPRE